MKHIKEQKLSQSLVIESAIITALQRMDSNLSIHDILATETETEIHSGFYYVKLRGEKVLKITINDNSSFTFEHLA